MRLNLLVRPIQKLIPKGWVMFNGETTVSIRDSWNVSSVSRTTTGRYVVNWARPFGYIAAATGYAVATTAKLDAGVASVTSHIDGTPTEGNSYTHLSTAINTSNNGTDTDADLCSVVVLGP